MGECNCVGVVFAIGSQRRVCASVGGDVVFGFSGSEKIFALYFGWGNFIRVLGCVGEWTVELVDGEQSICSTGIGWWI